LLAQARIGGIGAHRRT